MLLSLSELIVRRTNSTSVPTDCGVSNTVQIENNCPSSGWQAVEIYLSFTNGLLPSSLQSRYAQLPSPVAIQVTGANSIRQLMIIDQASVNSGSGYDARIAVATTQQSAVADALSTTSVLWSTALENVTTKGHGSVLDQLDAVHSIDTGYYQPYTAASCELDVIDGPEDTNPVAFPTPPEATLKMLNTSAFNDSILPGHAFIYSKITRPQILNTPGSPSDYRLRWIALPEPLFNGTAIGAAVLLPRASNNKTQEVLMCSLGAGWGTSKLNTSSFAGGARGVSSEVSVFVNTRMIDGKKSYLPPTHLINEYDMGNEGYFISPDYPQRPITVTEDWAQYLNPSISDSNTTVFNRLMASHLSNANIAVSVRKQ